VQAGLAACRAAERAVEILQERQAAEGRRQALRRGQLQLDEAAQRPRGRD
jgi:flagellar biosynthesis chaperone FliJ